MLGLVGRVGWLELALILGFLLAPVAITLIVVLWARLMGEDDQR